MRFGSVCSGIEAASVAWNPLGWEAAWLAEIEPFPSAVLKHHYPGVPNHGDMTALPERIRSGEVEAPDLFCGGTPCQAFSVAGKRQSLSDARGNLSLTFCDIADAIDESRSVRGLGAAIIFWENVPGVLSTSDNAFGCFLAQLCGGSEPLYAPDGWPDAGCVSGPSRTAAWRVLDAQYFGLAQRRRRVFVVASAREGFDPAAVLFEFDGVRRDTAPSREKREGLARGAENSIEVGGKQNIVPPIVGALTAKGPEAMGAPEVDGNHYFAVAQPIAWDEELNASIDQAGTLLRGGAGGRHDGVAVAFAQNQRDEVRQMDVAAALAAEPGAKQQTYIAFHPTQDPISNSDICHALGANENATATMAHSMIGFESSRRDGVRLYGDVTNTLQAFSGTGGGNGPMAVAFTARDYGNDATTELAPTMRSLARGADGHQSGSAGLAVMQPIPIDTMNHVGRGDNHSFGDLEPGAPSYTLTKGHSHAVAAPPTMQVRRLTPVECERLQGFPDGYTAIPWRGKPVEECPDGPRYKALGNSWAVPVVRWIGARIAVAL